MTPGPRCTWSPACRKFGSVINLTPSHSKITVAVPTNINLASSPPALEGWTFVSLASGSESGTEAPGGRSLVAGWALVGSRVRVRCFIVVVVCCYARLWGFGGGEVNRIGGGKRERGFFDVMLFIIGRSWIGLDCPGVIW